MIQTPWHPATKILSSCKTQESLHGLFGKNGLDPDDAEITDNFLEVFNGQKAEFQEVLELYVGGCRYAGLVLDGEAYLFTSDPKRQFLVKTDAEPIRQQCRKLRQDFVDSQAGKTGLAVPVTLRAGKSGKSKLVLHLVADKKILLTLKISGYENKNHEIIIGYRSHFCKEAEAQQVVRNRIKEGERLRTLLAQAKHKGTPKII